MATGDVTFAPAAGVVTEVLGWALEGIVVVVVVLATVVVVVVVVVVPGGTSGA